MKKTDNELFLGFNKKETKSLSKIKKIGIISFLISILPPIFFLNSDAKALDQNKNLEEIL